MSMPAAYRRLWWAGVVDNIGDGVFAAAVPLLAVTITHDPRMIAVVSAATMLPWLLLSLPVGALVDRHDRVGLMWRSQVLQGAVVTLLAVLAAVHLVGIVDLAVLAFVLGSAEVVFGNAAQSVLPDLVPPEQLHRANGQQYAAATAGQLFIGPPVGSLLFGVGVGIPFGVDAASFALSSALLFTLPRAARPSVVHPPMRQSIAEGLRWLAGDRLLRPMAILLGVNTFCGQFGNATFVLLATQTLHVSARGYGLVLSAAAVGAMLGGVVNARVVARVGETAAILGALGGMALAFLGIGLAPDVVMLAAAMAVNGLLVTLWNVVTVSLRQELVPANLRGRVNSVYRMIGWGFMPLGALAGGLVAHRFGLRAPYVTASVLRVVGAAVLVPPMIAALRAARARPGVADRRA